LKCRQCWLAVLLASGIAGCGTLHTGSRTASSGVQLDSLSHLSAARRWEQRAQRNDGNIRHWLNCATSAYLALESEVSGGRTDAAKLATHCASGFLGEAAAGGSRRWTEGLVRIDGVEIFVEFRNLSSYLDGPLSLIRAQDVSMRIFGGASYSNPGFGVPVVVATPRCQDRPLCELLPPEGVSRSATAWIEAGSGASSSAPRLVIADPLKASRLLVKDREYPLAMDPSSFYAWGAGQSALNRLAIWGLIGGDEIGRRAGVYLLDEYDQAKRPIVMIHGLGSSPLAWARLSNAIWGNADLRARFQVWHVVYQTNAPLLVTRRRIQGYLDEAWSVLDPEGDDPARSGIVLIGHSMGGMVARLLCADSGEVLWSSAFTSPPEGMRADPDRVAAIASIFMFKPYPGVSRAIFMAAPHGGSPAAESWFGRTSRVLVGRRVPELQTLRAFANDYPDLVRVDLRDTYQKANFNSISTLQISQPVRRAGETLLPAAGIPYHTIAGVLPGRTPASDGVVPLSSVFLPAASSTLLVQSNHKVYENPDAIAETLRILRLESGAAPLAD
jgi:pimeloyl-ACP methyl ester carboxylesterase